jgi:recombinational DNA repair protein (RecF pathway)
MTQHCAQCLSPLYATARQTPTGEVLCESCYSALWDSPRADELRMRVEAHSGFRSNGRPALITRR